MKPVCFEPPNPNTLRRLETRCQENLPSPSSRLSDSIVAFFDEFLSKQAELVAEWLRVGYVHGGSPVSSFGL